MNSEHKGTFRTRRTSSSEQPTNKQSNISSGVGNIGFYCCTGELMHTGGNKLERNKIYLSHFNLLHQYALVHQCSNKE